MVACVVLEILVEDLISWPNHDGGTELHRPASGLALPMPRGEGPETGGELARTDEGRHTDGARTHDLGSDAVLVEQHRERNPLVLDEGLRIPAPPGADSRDLRPGCENIFVPVSDLTGPLTARQSTEVPEEQDHLGLIAPEITQPLFGPVWVDQHVVCECL